MGVPAAVRRRAGETHGVLAGLGAPRILLEVERDRRPDLPDDREKAAYDIGKELREKKGLSNATYAAAEKAGAHLVTPRMGQAVSLANPPDVDFWWRELMDEGVVEQFSRRAAGRPRVSSPTSV